VVHPKLLTASHFIVHPFRASPSIFICRIQHFVRSSSQSPLIATFWVFAACRPLNCCALRFLFRFQDLSPPKAWLPCLFDYPFRTQRSSSPFFLQVCAHFPLSPSSMLSVFSSPQFRNSMRNDGGTWCFSPGIEVFRRAPFLDFTPTLKPQWSPFSPTMQFLSS